MVKKKTKKSERTKTIASVQPSIVASDSEATDPEDRILFIGSTAEVNRYLSENSTLMETQYRLAKRLLSRWKKELQSGQYGKVTGYGIELYAKRGMVVMPPQYCIVVALAEKAPPKSIRQARIELDPFLKSKLRPKPINELPRRYPEISDTKKSVRVKVVEANCDFASAIPNGKLASGIIDPPLDVSSPVQGGAAISKDAVNGWGTLGIIFPTKSGSMGMSCNHVVSSGTILQPPFSAIALGATRRPVGDVKKTSFSGASGVDASLILPSVATQDGVIDISSGGGNIKILVEKSLRWFTLGGQNVALRGARTGLHNSKFAEINNVDFSIEIDGTRFSDLIKVHSIPASATIVDEGDSGSALLLNLGGKNYVWIGIVVGMIDKHQLVACKLPNCMANLKLTVADFASKDLWKIP